MPKPLREIIAAIMNDVDAAAVSADVSRQYWQSVYDSNEMLRGSNPSRLRIVEVKVSLPVAFVKVEDVRKRDRGIQPRELASVLPPRLNQLERNRIAGQLHIHLQKTDQNRWLNDKLVDVIAREAEDNFKVKRDELDTDRLKKLQQEFIATPDEDQATEFLYSASELEQVDPSHIVRMDFIIGVD